jgi:FKBP-type peptidyl-prolyl cis-trans isomerase FkpA
MLKKLSFLLFVALIAVSACKKDSTDYAALDKQIIQDYLKAKGLTAKSTTSGLYYIIETPGNATKHPSLYSTVTVGYKGLLTNDTVFDESTSSTFTLSGTIKGWQEGIPLFGLGGKGKLFVPSDLGYGGTAQGKIPAHAVLVFDISLVDYY